MEYRILPRGGERISVLGMGSSVIGAQPEAEIIATVRAAVDAGVNYFDMAGGHAAIFGAYGKALDLEIEICSITNKDALRKVFRRYQPQIVINAAAHKHVPLMEKNCVEAVYNNVFGTRNLVELCEEFSTERFMMVSTDKAVNPTNVMGATKRMCEMIVQSASSWGNAVYSATRFGNVLGSAGSVIPLFKRQIANGGPITLTDKRIIRYFMTIPEASQLVLESGAMAQNGELWRESRSWKPACVPARSSMRSFWSRPGNWIRRITA